MHKANFIQQMPTIIVSSDPRPITYNLADTKLSDLENDFSTILNVKVGLPDPNVYEDQTNAIVKGTVTGMEGQKDIVIGHLIKLTELNDGTEDDMEDELKLPIVREISGEFMCDHVGFTVSPCISFVDGEPETSAKNAEGRYPTILPATHRGHGGGFSDDENGQTVSIMSQLILNSENTGNSLGNAFSPLAVGWMIRNTKQTTSDALDFRYHYCLNVRAHRVEMPLRDPSR